MENQERHSDKVSLMLELGLHPLIEFPGQNKGWVSKCLKCGAEVAPHFQSIASAIRRGVDRGCRACGARRAQLKRREQYMAELPQLLAGVGFELTGNWLSAKSKTDLQCLVCRREIVSTTDSVLGRRKTCVCQKKPRRPLAVFHPELAKELENDLNGELTGQNIGSGMRRNVWWRCPNGHVYDTWPARRVQGNGCRYCAGMAAYPGENDLATTHPNLVSELAEEQPNGVSAQSLKSGSNMMANWVCSKNSKHIYPMSPYDRITNNSGCSYCAGKRVLIGDNDLKTLFPEVAAEWDYELNFPQRPENFVAGSNKRFHWRCSWTPTHTWIASILTRTKGHGCNQCARVKTGFNDLQTRAAEDQSRSHLVIEWDQNLNEKDPKEVAFSDNDEYWWKCAAGIHDSYLAQCGNRWFSLTGCPSCAPSAYSTSKSGRFYFLSNSQKRAFKVGITNVESKTNRVEKFVTQGWSLEQQIENQSGLIIRNLEKRILYIIRQEWGLPAFLTKDEMRNQGGETETFSADFIAVDEMRKVIEFQYRLILNGS